MGGIQMKNEMEKRKRIALVAHDSRKIELKEFYNKLIERYN